LFETELCLHKNGKKADNNVIETETAAGFSLLVDFFYSTFRQLNTTEAITLLNSFSVKITSKTPCL